MVNFSQRELWPQDPIELGGRCMAEQIREYVDNKILEQTWIICTNSTKEEDTRQLILL